MHFQSWFPSCSELFSFLLVFSSPYFQFPPSSSVSIALLHDLMVKSWKWRSGKQPNLRKLESWQIDILGDLTWWNAKRGRYLVFTAGLYLFLCWTSLVIPLLYPLLCLCVAQVLTQMFQTLPASCMFMKCVSASVVSITFMCFFLFLSSSPVFVSFCLLDLFLCLSRLFLLWIVQWQCMISFVLHCSILKHWTKYFDFSHLRVLIFIH